MKKTHLLPADISISSVRPIFGEDEVREHLSSTGVVKWVRMGDLGTELHEACVDGRGDSGVIGTAGGNMGLFIEALAAMEQVSKNDLMVYEISQFFSWFVQKFGAFYMHSDTHALEHLRLSVQSDERFQDLSLSTLEGFERFVRKPALKYQEPLLEHMVDYRNIGCGHIKLMLSFPSQYGVRSGLVVNALRAFYRALWGHAGREVSTQLVFVVLDGGHAERAVVQVLVEGHAVTESTWIPTVKPMHGESQMFVAHPQAEAYMRLMMAQAIAKDKSVAGITASNSKQFVETMTRLGGEFLRETISHLAMGLPIYSVTFRKE